MRRKTITGINLANAGLYDNSFIPTADSNWKSDSINLPPGASNGNVRFKFEYTSSDLSNNIYLDDIAISIGNVGVEEVVKDYFALNVFPNPNKSGQVLNLNYSTKGNAKIMVSDILGKIVYQFKDQKGAGEHTLSLSSNEVNMGPGVYFINISDGHFTQTQKVIIY